MELEEGEEAVSDLDLWVQLDQVLEQQHSIVLHKCPHVEFACVDESFIKELELLIILTVL